LPELFAALPAPVDPWISAVLVAVSLLTSFITAAFGIGGGGILLAVMASLVPIQALIPVHGLVQLGSNAGRVTMFRRDIFRPALPAFVLGSVAGCALGGVVVVELPAEAVQIGIGGFVIWTVFARPPAWLRRLPVITGLISSFLTMFFGATGLFVAGFTKALDLPRHAHVATHAALMTAQHTLKVIVFGLLGFAFADWWVLVLAMILSGLAGTWAGRHVLNRMNDHGFRLALNAILVVLALRLIWTGLQPFFAGG